MYGGNTSVGRIIIDIPRRVDGLGLIVSLMGLCLISIAPLLGIAIGRYSSGSVVFPALWMLPVDIMYYFWLVYFSGRGMLSRLFNAAIFISVPFLLLFNLVGGEI